MLLALSMLVTAGVLAVSGWRLSLLQQRLVESLRANDRLLQDCKADRAELERLKAPPPEPAQPPAPAEGEDAPAALEPPPGPDASVELPAPVDGGALPVALPPAPPVDAGR
jgi:hypothetical protein